MTKQLFSLISLLFLFTFLGCSPLTSQHQGILGKQSIKEDKAKAKIEQVDKDSAKVNSERLKNIGAFSYGVEYALDRVESTNRELSVAYDLNTRIQSLSDKPSIDAIKEMQLLVGQMVTNNTVTLQKKDKQISSLQSAVVDLQKAKDTAINQYMVLADVNAAKADQYKASLNDMDAMFGLGAVWYGLKHLITRLAWGIGIFSVLYIVLRIASMSNPIAGAAFSIFDTVFSWGIHAIKVMAPKALNVAGMVEQKMVDEYKQTLTEIVDSIQTVKGNPSSSVNDLLTEISKNMDSADKQRVDEIKKQLNWK